METKTILIIGFLGVLSILWAIFEKLIDIDLRSKHASEHLFEIKGEIENNAGLRGSKWVDLSDIEDHLQEINNKLESIESLVDVIKDEK